MKTFVAGKYMPKTKYAGKTRHIVCDDGIYESLCGIKPFCDGYWYITDGEPNCQKCIAAEEEAKDGTR